MTSILVVLTGLLVRIAIPALLVAGAIFILRRLDAHWQAEAIAKEKIESSHPHSQTWELKDCPIEGFAERPALQSTEPCWETFRESNGTLHEECLRCKVFRATPILLPN